jgi:DNA-binding transcriptional ArsR family regulator
MEMETVVLRLSALAQDTRLQIFRLLVRAGPNGMAAGEIAKALAVPANTLSAHLNILANSGLVQARRVSRSRIYAAQYDAMRALLAFLLEDCCQGKPEMCAPLFELANCCPPRTTK